MAGYKQYKNVYTILEKVKKGEIQSHYSNDDDGLFGKINFYKKGDLVKPYMHYIDERRVDTVIDGYMTDISLINKAYTKLNDVIPEDKKPNFDDFSNKVRENYRKLPRHLSKDIHKMFYHKIENLEFEDRSDANHTKFRLLEKSNNPVAKIMAEGSNLKSTIYARNIMAYFAVRSAIMEYIDPDANKQFMNGMNGQGTPEEGDEALQKMLDGQSSKQMFDKAIQDATDICKTMDECVDKDTQEKMFENITKDGGKQAGSMSPDYLRKVVQELTKLKLSMNSVKDKVKKLLDKSASYFSSRKEVMYDDLFNTDNLAGLNDYIELHPKLRKVFIEDILVKDEKPIGKLDIYIDISGSMSDNCGIQDVDNKDITKLDFCKAFTMKLKEMNMLNDVYLFNTTVTKHSSDPIALAMIDVCGGTRIDMAIDRINKEGVNAIIITDAEDSCRIFSDKAFFIGVKGSNFTYFNSDVINKYSENNQVVVFDGTRIYNVDRKGKTVD